MSSRFDVFFSAGSPSLPKIRKAEKPIDHYLNHRFQIESIQKSEYFLGNHLTSTLLDSKLYQNIFRYFSFCAVHRGFQPFFYNGTRFAK
jgi:hypothetical protein